MKTLAIHGHPTRGKEVIEILEMLGGENKAALGGNSLYIYYIDCNNRIDLSSKLQDKFVTFHLEEFLEKYPYKVGDKVLLNNQVKVIKDIGWDSKNNEVIYTLETNINGVKTQYQVFNYDLQPYNTIPDITIDEEKLIVPKGYTVKTATCDGDSLIVEYIKNKPQYPKTYEESCEVISINRHDVEIDIPQPYQQNIAHFFRLLICRDAYWKIADNWKPYWNNDTQFKYIITCRRDNIIKDTYTAKNCILAFPTKEMRDIFLENFKNLIEKCKEFL